MHGLQSVQCINNINRPTVCSGIADSGRELQPGDKQLAVGVAEVQVMAAEITCSFATDHAEDDAEVGRVRPFVSVSGISSGFQ